MSIAWTRPDVTTTAYSLEQLLYLMRRLRDPEDGCPWDTKQTFETIVPFTLEEVYEVVDTIERKDFSHLREELGDLLFQVVFYSQLGEEQGLFDFNGIVSELVAKLVSRHPHVFPLGTLDSRREAGIEPEEGSIKQNWESLKRNEREQKGHRSILDDIPHSLPSLTRAQKLQKRAANHGFDWPDSHGVMDKLTEEVDELQVALSEGESEAIAEELGDVLFTVVNLCRHQKVDAETALRAASRKFEKRFQFIERSLNESGENIDNCSLERLDALWEKAKHSD
ncbi:MAG: nucleoside triphosphate pyrophosphohydrolase [Gammaproteobacteria bacterium]|nr:MAG: nucleoside triphosphate pyrophosphohydrolase [Gammaproteobacteria bacterium]